MDHCKKATLLRCSVTVAWPEQPAGTHGNVRFEKTTEKTTTVYHDKIGNCQTCSKSKCGNKTTTKMAANQLRAAHVHAGFTIWSDDNVVDTQGADSVRELGRLNNDDVINLCKTIRRPGGHLPNPAFVAGGAMNPVIPHIGIMVSQSAKTNMQLASHTVRHHNRISQAANVPAMNLTSIRRLCELKIEEEFCGTVTHLWL
jgi:hypothetical protein